MGRARSRAQDRAVHETRGNPLAILELPRGLAATQLPVVFGREASSALSGQIEASFVRRLGALPDESRLLLLVAAAMPDDDPVLVWREAERLGIGRSAAGETDGLLAVDERVMFLHPLVRSAVYRCASPAERRAVHLGSDMTDAELDPDRRGGIWRLRRRVPTMTLPLFLSPRTVEWHLKVFGKLGISSRMGLHEALPARPPST